MSTEADLAGAVRQLDDDQFEQFILHVLESRPAYSSVKDEVVTVLRIGRTGAGLVRAWGSAPTRVASVDDLLREDDLAPADEVLRQLRIEAEARRRALVSTQMLDASAVGALLQASGGNPRDAASAARRQSKLLGIEQGGRILYPAFQIDATQARVFPIVAETNLALRAAEDPWGVFSWWVSPSPRRADGKAPAELVRDQCDEDIRDLVSAILND